MCKKELCIFCLLPTYDKIGKENQLHPDKVREIKKMHRIEIQLEKRKQKLCRDYMK